MLPWVEKYRPTHLNDVVHQSEVTEALRRCLHLSECPNLLFYGPPGTGKTSVALAAANDLFGAYRSSRVLELNASDDRGIQVVRTKVKRFAKLAPSGAADSVSGASGASTSMPSFKLVILDEADAMTEDAQNALRRMMETYAPTTRFCLICNYVSRIIEPLASRCAKFRFSPVPIPLMVQRMQRILAAETDATQSATQGTTQGALDETLLTQLAELTEGDMRRAIMYVQNAVRLRLDAVTMDTFLELAGYVPQHQIATLYAAMRQGDHDAVRTHLIQLVDREGYTGASIVSQLHAVLVPTSVTVATTPVIVATTPAPALGTVDHTVVETPMDVDRPPISDAVLAECCLVLGATSRALADGADELVQLLAAATKCMELFSTKSV